jgi:hypothetical protein
MQLLFFRSEKSEDTSLTSLQQSGCKRTIVRSGPETLGADESIPPYFPLNLFALAGGDTFFLIVEIHWANFFRITPILYVECQIVAVSAPQRDGLAFTMRVAVAVAFLRSDDAPLVTFSAPKISSSATRPPSATSMSAKNSFCVTISLSSFGSCDVCLISNLRQHFAEGDGGIG